MMGLRPTNLWFAREVTKCSNVNVNNYDTLY